jgi:cytochrome c biogenesis factor
VSPFTFDEANRTVIGATMEVARAGEAVTTLEPRLNQFDNASSLIGTPAVYTTWGGDLYLTLRSTPDPGITMSFDSSPMMWTVWLGGLTAGAGGFIAMRGRRRVRSAERARTAAS